MKRKRYIYIIIFLVLLAIVFGFKKVSNNTEATLTQEDCRAWVGWLYPLR
jgi:thioredoxin 1